MKKLFARLRYYSFSEGFTLIIALFIDSLYKRIPKQVFLINNIYKHILANGGSLRRRENQISIDFKDLKWTLRTKGSDFLVFNQIVLGGGMERVIHLLTQLKISNPNIMDCGANIGLATLEFKRALPDAQIIAVEPESDNYKQLTKNIHENSFRDVQSVNMGVWYVQTNLAAKKDFRDGGEWSFALQESAETGAGTIEVDTPENIARRFGWSKIDLLKIDIEGSEFPLFRNVGQWKRIFDTVKIVSIEVHEEIGAITEIISILEHNNFRIEVYQEFIIGVRI